MWTTCFFAFQVSSQEDSLLKLLTTERHKVTKEKLQFAQTRVQYLAHMIAEQGLHMDSDRLRSVLSFPKLKTKHRMQGLLKLFGYG